MGYFSYLCSRKYKMRLQSTTNRPKFERMDVSIIIPVYNVEPYIEALKRIRPSKVMIYTIDRETPVQGLQKAAPEVYEVFSRTYEDGQEK